MKKITKLKGFGISALLIVVLLVFTSAVNGDDPKGPELTENDLQDMYRRYNVTENDIKFASNELPNYLNGTILNSDTRVIATETGEPPEELKEGEDYDIVISTEEMFAIIDDARERYIEKYGVDSSNPKLDDVDGNLLPNEEAKRLVINGKIDDLGHAEPLVGILGGPHNGPHSIDGKVDAQIFVAKDNRHEPTENIKNDTCDALNRFESEFGVNMTLFWYWNFWNASDVSSADNCSNALYDLMDDCSWVVDQENDTVIGWMHDMNHNGMAFADGFYTVCSDTANGFSYDWPHDSIVQHETSHLFNAPEGGWWCNEHPECVMNYCWAALHGTYIWCDSCRETVNENIWGD